MKLYVVTCCEYDGYTNRYDRYVGTIGVFTMKHFAEQKINQLYLTDEKLGNDYGYHISECEA